MIIRAPYPIAAASVLLLSMACARRDSRHHLPAEPAAELAAIQQSPERTGARIYEGKVFSLDSTRTAPLFRYDRRVRATASGFVSTHITRDPADSVVVTQIAEHDSAYVVTRASLIQKQSGLTGSVDVAGDRLHFTLVKDGKLSTATESAIAPLVAGPTMFGFILKHWNELTSGRTVPLRFAVLELNKSIGFVLERVAEQPDRLTIRMTASSWLVRRFVAPTYFYFDPATKKVLGYDGRVPPLEQVGDDLRTLDARVHYTHYAAVYQ